MGNLSCLQAPPPPAKAKSPIDEQRVHLMDAAGTNTSPTVISISKGNDRDVHGHQVSKITHAFRLHRQIAKTPTAVITAVTDKKSSKSLAMKRLKKSTTKKTPSTNTLVVQEIRALSLVSHHPNIIHLHGLWHDDKHFYILTSICEGGDLVERLVTRRNKRFAENTARHFLRCILRGVAHAHERNVVHRDIKIEHFMFETRDLAGEPILIDWGDALVVADDDVITRDNFAGSPEYLCPEIARSRRGWELKKGDLWAVGVTGYILLFGRMPFSGKDMKSLFEHITCGEIVFEMDGYTISEDAQGFLRACLNRDVSARVSAQEALEMPWFSQ